MTHRSTTSAAEETAFRLRAATAGDVPALGALIERSAAGLSVGFYTAAQVASATRHVFGVDTQLIADGTYYAVERGSTLVAAGGWSIRRTLFGGDQLKQDGDIGDALLDPGTSPARIRAFFVDPSWARRGLGRLLYTECERAARAAGFRAFELVATLPGEPLYAALGFTVTERYALDLPEGVSLPVARMIRTIDR
ncbi:MAG TPA: GNAT family N-acetyltransferase [Gemmatimonadaceae bacterium]|nr:GNAT family N-acetyltransferase [Gemmatimonadaceae bacterium]